MYSKRSSYIGKEVRTGRITCRVKDRCKRPQPLEAGATAVFGIRIVNLDVGSYLHMTPEKDLAKGEK